MKTDASENVLRLDPKVILADENSRYGLKPLAVEQLAESIKEEGDVIEPCEVEVLDKPQGKFTHRLTIGFCRHAAVTALNKQGADLLLPCLVRPAGTPLDRMRRQLAENLKRDSLSPIDCAKSIKDLKDLGVANVEIRRMFARPGGRKGNVITPASLTFVEKTVRLLELPKDIREKIHDGRISVAAAYQLMLAPPEKRAEIVQRAEEARVKEFEKEEAADNKILDEAKKAQKAVEDQEKAAKELAVAQTEVAPLKQEAEKEAAKVAELYAKVKTAPPAEHKAAREALTKAEEKLKEVQKKAQAAEAKVKKLAGTTDKTKALAEKQKAKLAEARKAAEKKKPLGTAAIKKAAAEDGLVKLNVTQIREFIFDASRPSGSCPKTQAIFAHIQDCLDSKITPHQAFVAVAKVVGEKAGKEAKAGKEKAEKAA